MSCLQSIVALILVATTTFFMVTGPPHAMGLRFKVKSNPLPRNMTNSLQLIEKNTLIQPTKFPTGFFFVEVSIGKPPSVQTANLALDTSTPLTWVQCSNCLQCFPVSVPNFDPANSTKLPSENPLCVPPITGPFGRSCHYDLMYAAGPMLKETFALPSDQKNHNDDVNNDTPSSSTLSLNTFAFGCGLFNYIGFPLAGPGPNPIGGVIGLSMGHPISLLSQLNSNESMHKFSYCLPDPDVQTTASRRENKLQPTLDIGSDATIAGDIQSTAILKSQCHDKYYYYLNMTAISVNGKHLRIDPRIFVPTSSGTEGFIIQPGTAVTLLAKEAFRSLKSSVSKEVLRRYPELVPVKNSKSGFDLCYSTKGAICNVSEMSFPKVQFYFHSDDGDGRTPNIVLQKLFITVHTPDEELCMPITQKMGVGPSILGGLNQIKTRFLVDIGQSKFYLSANQC